MAAATLALAKELSRKAKLRCAALAGDDTYAIEVAGDGRYQGVLADLAGGPTTRDVRHKCIALLVPEPAPRDRGRVLVQISGHDVGHLSRRLGRVFCRELAAAGCSAAVASAIIVEWNRLGGDAGQFRVRLDSVHPFRFEGIDEDVPAGSESAPSSENAKVENPAGHLPMWAAWSMSAVVASERIAAMSRRIALWFISITSWSLANARRLLPETGTILAGIATKRSAFALAIFLCGMATGAALVIWLRPAGVPPVAVKLNLSTEPDAQAEPRPAETAVPDPQPAEASPTETAGPDRPAADPSPIEIAAPAVPPPLPRRRPATAPSGPLATGRQGDKVEPPLTGAIQ